MDHLIIPDVQPDELLEETFQHSPLPGPDYIRVVTILPADSLNLPLECEIETRPLDKSADYEALSYSWGMHADGDATLNRTLSINGQIKRITRNLFEGLLRLRAGGWPRRLWVDAICINQADDGERSQQVSRMGAVFKNAKHTIVWLGEGASVQEDLNVAQLSKCASQSAADASHVPGTHIWRGADGKELSICDLRLPRQWDYYQRGGTRLHVAADDELRIVQSVAAIFRRRYFRRRWIFQELWNSSRSNLQAYWGPCSSQLEYLFGEHGILSFFYYRSQQRETATLERKISSDIQSATTTYDLIFHTPSIDLRHALQYCYSMECSDARDRLFSLLSVDSTFGIIPDYSLSTAAVCIQLARRLIENDFLAFILRSNSAQDRPTDLDLPSWVLDIRQYFLSSWGGLRTEVEELEFHQLNIKLSNDNVLTLLPYLCGVVESVEHVEENFRSKFKLLSHVPVTGRGTWMPAREYVEKNTTDANCETITTDFELLGRIRTQPGDFCCSLFNDVWNSSNCIFILRAAQLENDVFQLIEGIDMDKTRPQKGLNKVEFPQQAMVRTTVNII